MGEQPTLGAGRAQLSRWRRHARSPVPTARVWSWKGQGSAPPRPGCRAASQIDQHQPSAAAPLPDVSRQSDIRWRTARPTTPSSGRAGTTSTGVLPLPDSDRPCPPVDDEQVGEVFVSELPKATSSKIRRRELRLATESP